MGPFASGTGPRVGPRKGIHTGKVPHWDKTEGISRVILIGCSILMICILIATHLMRCILNHPLTAIGVRGYRGYNPRHIGI